MGCKEASSSQGISRAVAVRSSCPFSVSWKTAATSKVRLSGRKHQDSGRQWWSSVSINEGRRMGVPPARSSSTRRPRCPSSKNRFAAASETNVWDTVSYAPNPTSMSRTMRRAISVVCAGRILMFVASSTGSDSKPWMRATSSIKSISRVRSARPIGRCKTRCHRLDAVASPSASKISMTRSEGISIPRTVLIRENRKVMVGAGAMVPTMVGGAASPPATERIN